jgi:hypothetical protein
LSHVTIHFNHLLYVHFNNRTIHPSLTMQDADCPERKKGRNLFRSILRGRGKDSSDTSEATKAPQKRALIAPLPTRTTLPIVCPGFENSHGEFAGTMSDLRSRAESGCTACSIVFDGLVSINPQCKNSKTEYSLSWKAQGKGTLTVLMHRGGSALKDGDPRVFEYLHDLGPFGRSRSYVSRQFLCLIC